MRKSKKLISAVLTPVAFVPLASVALVGCSDKYSKIVDKLNADFEEEFRNVCSVGRPTFENREFCNYMIAHIQQLGIKSESIVTDAETYKPEGDHPKHGFNFYYDIPATEGLENSDGIILQCHTDMVWTTTPDAQLTHPIVVKEKDKQGNWVMHSKGYQSSLGADDGAGIATCLAITKNANEFEHGPIRVLMTTDEEDGISGAHYVPETWLQSSNEKYKIKYLLNIDLEETNKICKSTAGVQQASWTKDFTPIKDLAQIAQHGITLVIRGLAGGHSAKVIKEGKLNAIKLGIDILDELNKRFIAKGNPESCQLFSAFENSKIGSATPGTVPNAITLDFATNYGPYTNINEIVQDIVNDIKKKTTDNQFEVEVSYFDYDVKHVNEVGVVSTQDTRQIINFVKALPYEVSEYLDPQTKQSPATSINVGAFRFRDGKYSSATEGAKLYLEMFGRSCYEEVLGPKPSQYEPSKWDGFMKKFLEISQKEFGANDGTWDCTVGWNPCWKTKESDKLPELLMQAAEHYGTKAEYLDEHSWLEIGEFALKSQNQLDISAIGPTIDHVHNIMETLYLDTVPTMFKNLVYVLDNIIQRKES